MAYLILRKFGSMLLSSSRSTGGSNFYLPLASIASSPSIFSTQKPYFPRSASSATSSKRPSKPTFSPPAKGFPSRSKNHETRFPSQSHTSSPKSEANSLFVNTVKNMEGLKNALAILSVVQINTGAWIAYIAHPFYPSVLAQIFGSSAIQVVMVLIIRHVCKKITSLHVKSHDDTLRVFVGFLFASGTVCVGTILLNVLYWGSSFWVIKKLLGISSTSSVEIFTLTFMTLPFPLLSLVSLLRMGSAVSKPLPGLREGWSFSDRIELLKGLNFVLHGSKRACYWALGLSSALLLNYGIVSYYIE